MVHQVGQQQVEREERCGEEEVVHRVQVNPAQRRDHENQKEKETEVEMLKWKYDKLREEMNQQFNQILVFFITNITLRMAQ